MNSNRFGHANDDNFKRRASEPENVSGYIANMLNMDGMSDTSFGTWLAEKHALESDKSGAVKMPENNSAPVKTDDFTEQVKIIIEDCFSGIVIRDGIGSINYISPNKTIFKIQITKL